MNKRLFFLLNSLAGGGAEKVVVNLFKMLSVEKIFLLEKEIKYEIFEKDLVFLSTHTPNTNPIFKTFFLPIYAQRLAKKIDKNSIVVSFLERANYVNVMAKSISKHKAIVSIRMSQSAGRRHFHPYNFISKLLYPKADKVVCVSRVIAKELREYYQVPEDKLFVIYNPIFLEEIVKLAKEQLGEYDSIFNYSVLITSARLTKQKGQWYLLRIFKELKKIYPELKLVILGDGELKDYLVNLSNELGLKPFVWDKDNLSDAFDVYFLGFQKNPFKFIARAKLFIFQSLWEGFPNALIESMACGVPIISSDCKSGPREILAPDTDFAYQTDKAEFAQFGILMPVLEVKYKEADEPLDKVERMWVEAITKLLENEDLRLEYTIKAKERTKDFDIDKIAQEWRSLLNNSKKV